ncbi:AsmA family protein [Fundidesulfovibrio magnetotacticus]|uniref:AsmA family protein n=1 Tax=Fundidesulfovibrio magnetotacticus TaxID=2730080 RepID=UPI0015634360|nr:AsmA family protein [Fundidesulfovibrio magnetotacticus]
MKPVARAAIILGGILALALAGLAVLAATLDLNLFKERLGAALKDATGLEISFDGPLSSSFLPTLSVSLERVSLRSPLDPPGAPPLASLGSARASLRVLPLLSGRVEVETVSVRGLALTLRRDAQGRLNLPTPKVKSVAVEGEKVVVVTQSDERILLDYRLEALDLQQCALSWEDQASGAALRLDNVTLTARGIARGASFPVSFSLDYALASPKASGRLELSGKGQAWPEALRFVFADAAFKATLSGENLPVRAAETTASGTLRADFTSQTYAAEGLLLAAKASGGLLPADPAVVALGLDAGADLAKGTAQVTGLKLDAAGLKLAGEARAEGLSGGKAGAGRFTARLASETFDLGAFLARFGVALPEAGPAGFSLELTADRALESVDISSLKLSALGLDLSGSARAALAGDAPEVKGALVLAPCEPRAVMRRLGVAARPAGPDALASLAGAVDFEHRGQRTKISTREFQLDRQPLSLTADVDRSAPRPKVSFALKAASLDLDALLPAGRADAPGSNAPGGGEKPGTAPAKEARKTPQAGAEPSGSPADVSGVVDVASLKAAKLRMRDVHARLEVREKSLELDPLRLSLYQGTLRASASTGLEPGASRPLSLKASAEGVQLEPLLKDLTGKARITGRAGLNAALTARGDDEARLLSSLGGRFSFSLRDGMIPGVDLTPAAFSTPEKVAAQGSGQGGTRYESVTGSFTVANGVATGNDLVAVVPPHRVEGQGSVNLAARTLDYRLLVRFAKLAAIPVQLKGSLESPGVSVDAAALAGLAAKGALDAVTGAPGAVIKTPGDVGKGALDVLGNILGGPRKK